MYRNTKEATTALQEACQILKECTEYFKKNSSKHEKRIYDEDQVCWLISCADIKRTTLLRLVQRGVVGYHNGKISEKDLKKHCQKIGRLWQE